MNYFRNYNQFSLKSLIYKKCIYNFYVILYLKINFLKNYKLFKIFFCKFINKLYEFLKLIIKLKLR